jgi:hypothetical protein
MPNQMGESIRYLGRMVMDTQAQFEITVLEFE